MAEQTKTTRSQTASQKKAQNVNEQATEQVQAAIKAGQQSMEDAVKAGQETVQKAVKAGKESTEKTLKASEEALTKSYDQVVDAAKAQVQKSMPEAADRFDEFAAYQKDNLQAFFNASAIAAKGAETLGEEILAYNQAALDATLTSAKKLLEVKTAQQLVEVQSQLARDNFDRFVSETGKLSELAMKVTNEAFEPLQTRFNKTFETFSKPIAG